MDTYMMPLRDIPRWRQLFLSSAEKDYARKVEVVLDLQSEVSQQYTKLFEEGRVPLKTGYGDGFPISNGRVVIYNGETADHNKPSQPVSRVRIHPTVEAVRETKKTVGKWISEEKFRIDSFPDTLEARQSVHFSSEDKTGVNIGLQAYYTLKENYVVELDRVIIDCRTSIGDSYYSKKGRSWIDISGKTYERVVSFDRDNFNLRGNHKAYARINSDNLSLIIHAFSAVSKREDRERDVVGAVQTELPLARNILRDLRGYYEELNANRRAA